MTYCNVDNYNYRSYSFCYRKPTATGLPNWPPVGADWSPYMALNKTVQLMSHPIKERVLLWDDIYDKYYRYPVAPNPPRYRHSEL